MNNILENPVLLGQTIREMRKQKSIAAGENPHTVNKMYTYEIDGVTFKTNYGADYPYWDGNSDQKCASVGFRESCEDVLQRLVADGYTKIRFVYTTTRVRGFHNYHALYS